jgi:hypothetical protein
MLKKLAMLLRVKKAIYNLIYIQPIYGPGVIPASNKSEYQEYYVVGRQQTGMQA